MESAKKGNLEGKVALVFGAGGAIGSTVCETLAREGAIVYMSGRTLSNVNSAFKKIGGTGSKLFVDEVNAIDENQVDQYFENVYKKEGKIDIVFNAIGSRMDGAIHVQPSTETSLDVFKMYLNNMVLSQFLTARVGARYMAKQNKGSIVLMTATPSRGVAPFLPGASVGHAAIDGLARCLATEFGQMGIRVNAVMSGGMQETDNIKQVLSGMAKLTGAPIEAMMQGVKEKSVLKRTSTLKETAEVVGFLASDLSSSITGAIINASCGEVLD